MFLSVALGGIATLKARNEYDGWNNVHQRTTRSIATDTKILSV